jgi:hypothetical protein
LRCLAVPGHDLLLQAIEWGYRVHVPCQPSCGAWILLLIGR